MDWDKLKVFHAAAEAGSFTHAGEQLGLSQSAVSRQVSALEQELSVSLFHRHARGLILTEQGDLLFQIDPRPYESALRQAEAQLTRDEAQAKNAEEQAKRYQILVQKDYVSKDQYDQLLERVQQRQELRQTLYEAEVSQPGYGLDEKNSG